MLGFNIDDKSIYNTKSTGFNNFHLHKIRDERQNARKMRDKLNSIYYPPNRFIL